MYVSISMQPAVGMGHHIPWCPTEPPRAHDAQRAARVQAATLLVPHNNADLLVIWRTG